MWSALPPVPGPSFASQQQHQQPPIVVLVLGDAGVGKTQLVHVLCHRRPPETSPAPTVGCAVEVCDLAQAGAAAPGASGAAAAGGASPVHGLQAGAAGPARLVELWDVTGQDAYRETRPVLYRAYHGLLLVHDLNNSKSLENLRRVWYREIVDAATGREPPLPFEESWWAWLTGRGPSGSIGTGTGTGTGTGSGSGGVGGRVGRVTSSEALTAADAALDGPDAEETAGDDLPPVLVVGTKADLAGKPEGSGALRRLVQRLQCDYVNLDLTCPTGIDAAGRAKLQRFFEAAHLRSRKIATPVATPVKSPIDVPGRPAKMFVRAVKGHATPWSP